MQIRCKQVCLLPEFFVEFVYSEETRIRFDQMVGGTTNPHLNVSDVRALLLRAPSIDEQKRIVEKIAAVRGAIQQSLSQKEKLSVLKTALMQDLLTGRKRVTDLLEPIAA
jgi:type I restriction enzyme S subunit